jgi:hypothetical protein
MTTYEIKPLDASTWDALARLVELPNIHHRKEYEAAGDEPPDYRITVRRNCVMRRAVP